MWIVALALIAGCRARATTLPVDNQVSGGGPVRSDADALARWRELHLTGANHQAALATISPDDAPAMARAMLRAGNFVCPGVEANTCGGELELPALDPEATLDDPCLRRELALWSIDHLDPSDGPQLSSVLEGLVAMAPPEGELQEAAYKLVGGDDDLRMDLLRVSDKALAETEAAGLVSRDARREAATDLHLASAVTELASDPAANHDALLGALADLDVAAETRLALIHDVFAHDPSAQDALRGLATDDDNCEIAEAAAEALADQGDGSLLPARPRSPDAEAHMRALCMLSYAQLPDVEQRRRAWIGGKGVREVDTTEGYLPDPPPVDSGGVPNSDGVIVEVDGDRVTTTSTVAPADVDMGTIDAALDGWSCDGLVCGAQGGAVITFVISGGSLVIESYSTLHEEYDDC